MSPCYSIHSREYKCFSADTYEEQCFTVSTDEEYEDISCTDYGEGYSYGESDGCADASTGNPYDDSGYSDICASYTQEFANGYTAGYSEGYKNCGDHECSDYATGYSHGESDGSADAAAGNPYDDSGYDNRCDEQTQDYIDGYITGYMDGYEDSETCINKAPGVPRITGMHGQGGKLYCAHGGTNITELDCFYSAGDNRINIVSPITRSVDGITMEGGVSDLYANTCTDSLGSMLGGSSYPHSGAYGQWIDPVIFHADNCLVEGREFIGNTGDVRIPSGSEPVLYSQGECPNLPGGGYEYVASGTYSKNFCSDNAVRGHETSTVMFDTEIKQYFCLGGYPPIEEGQDSIKDTNGPILPPEPTSKYLYSEPRLSIYGLKNDNLVGGWGTEDVFSDTGGTWESESQLIFMAGGTYSQSAAKKSKDQLRTVVDESECYEWNETGTVCQKWTTEIHYTWIRCEKWMIGFNATGYYTFSKYRGYSPDNRIMVVFGEGLTAFAGTVYEHGQTTGKYGVWYFKHNGTPGGRVEANLMYIDTENLFDTEDISDEACPEQDGTVPIPSAKVKAITICDGLLLVLGENGVIKGFKP